MITRPGIPPDRYTCEDTLRRLDDYLDRELSDAEMQMVREHLETCAACVREYAFEGAVLREMRAKLRHIAAPAELTEKVAAILAAARRDEG